MSGPRGALSERVAYVVIGSHRSGTSAMARALNLAGFGALPADLLPPHPTDNPAGFWEARPVVDLNEALLGEAGGAWDRPPRRSGPARRAIDRAETLLAHQFARPGSVVLKDPRISLLVPVWHAALTGRGLRPVYVVMLRHPAEVAASLEARPGFAAGAGQALWAAYMLAAEHATRERDRIVVPFDDLLADGRGVLARIATVAGGSASALDPARFDAVAGFLTPSLKRRHRPEHASGEADGIRAERIHALLSTGADHGAARAELDALAGHSGDSTEDAAPRARGRPPRPDRATWLLVTGAPRSGTSLLRALLAAHPEVALLQEYGLTRLVARIDAIVARPAPAGADWDRAGDPDDARFNAASAFYRDRPGREAVTRGGGDPRPEHFHDVAAGLFAGLFPDKAPRILGDKMPIAAEWEDLPLLFERLPGFRIVAVIRNPADVVRSSLVRREATRRGRDTWPIRTVEEAAAQWIMAWRGLNALVRRHGPAVRVVKYEDLCARPQTTMDGICAWLGLAPHAVTLPIASLPPGLALHTAAERDALDRLLSPVIDAWPNRDAEALMTQFDGLHAPYRLGAPILLGDEAATPYLVSGFSFREEWGRWTDGPRAVLSIPHGQRRGLLLVEIRTVQAFARGADPCDVVVRSGWGEPKLFSLGAEPGRIAFVAQAEETQEPGHLTVEILIAHPKTPEEAPADSRALGILMQSVRVSRLGPEDC